MSSRSLASGSIVVLLGQIARQGGLIVAFAILSRCLAKGDYGQFQLAWMVGSVVSQIAALGIPQSMLFFIPRIRGLAARRRGFLQSICLLQFGGLLGGLAVSVFARQFSVFFTGDEDLTPVLRMYWIVVPFLAFSASASPIMHSIERSKLTSLVNCIGGLSNMVAIATAAYLSANLYTVFGAQAIAGVFLVAVGSFIGLTGVRELGADVAAPSAGPEGLTIRRQLGYSLPLMGSVVVSVASISVARTLVRHYYSDEQFAEFANGAIEIPVGTLMMGAVYSVILPRLSGMFAAKDHKGVVSLLHLSTQNIAMIVFPASVFLAVFSRDCMVVLFGRSYAASGQVLMVYSIGMLMRILAAYRVMAAAGKPHIVLRLTLLSLVGNFLACWLAIELLGMIGPAIGQVAHRVLVQLIFLLIIARETRTTLSKVLPWKHLARILTVSAAAGLAAGWLLVLPVSPIVRLVVAAAIFTVVYFLLARKFRVIQDVHFRVLKDLAAKVTGRSNTPEQ